MGVVHIIDLDRERPSLVAEEVEPDGEVRDHRCTSPEGGTPVMSWIEGRPWLYQHPFFHVLLSWMSRRRPCRRPTDALRGRVLTRPRLVRIQCAIAFGVKPTPGAYPSRQPGAEAPMLV